ncbi:MAG: lamin tail domain-containing protein, partial [Verrucomicrobiota bacterium]
MFTQQSRLEKVHAKTFALNKIFLPGNWIRIILFLTFLAVLSGRISAAQIPGLFNTGISANGSLAPDGSVDLHYRMVQSADPFWPGPGAIVVNAGFPGPWLATTASSKWIAPQASQMGGNGPGDYKYRITFDLTGLEPASAILTGRWASDNLGTDILLNGVSLGLSNPGQFAAFSPVFTINSGFIDGTNTLDFIVNNAGTGANPTGFRAELSGTAELIPPPGTPPSITGQPSSRVVSSGESVSFTVGATGSRPLNYQWRLNGQVLLNATNSILTIGSVSGSDIGGYDVVVSNNWGSATSAVATLKSLLRLGPSSRRTPLVISEIMYNPRKRTDGKNLEYIEIHNTNPFFEDVSGFRISGNYDFVIPPNTKIPADGYLLVAAAPADVQSVYGITNVLGGFTNNLSNSSGTVRLRKKSGAVILEVTYSDQTPWPIAADGAGHSLVLAKPWLGEANPQAWSASSVIGGSPGADDLLPNGPLENVMINEILAHTDDPVFDFVELYNHSTNAVNLSGCWLSDNPDTNKFRIPEGTILGARQRVAFDQNQMGFSLSADGDDVFFVNSNQTRVIDAVRFTGQRNGVSLGRYPDGAPTFHELSARTPGAANAPLLLGDIVINEIMYDPISGDDDDEYVELYNRGTNAVDLAGWKFVAGIDFTFPTGAIIGAKGYLVVARNARRLMTNYLNLSSANLFGNFGGKLSNSGERIALGFPDSSISVSGGVTTTNHFFIVVNEVTYGTGGRWGNWSHGGGSSLELIDARSDNRLSANWSDSDETGKAPWTVISNTGTLDNGSGSYAQLQVLLLDAGEALLDDVQVFTTGGNMVANSNFEGGISGWTAQGTHILTSWETNGGYGSARSLHLRATGRGDIAANRVRTPLTQTLTSGTATIQAKARWLRGHPEVLLRLKGNYLETFGRLTVPANLGTPGMANSIARLNTGPAISDVSHLPVLPAAGQIIHVTARAHDSDGLASMTLRYRLDPSSTVFSLAMNDGGTNGDVIAGDGIFSANIPGQADGTLVAFRVEAADGFSPAATTKFPADAPTHECLVRVGESLPPGAFGTYRLWITEATRLNWSNAEKQLSNEPFDATFVYGNSEVVYNVGTHYSGSPYTAPSYNGPTANLCGYDLLFPEDHALLGETHFILDWPVRDSTDQREQLMFWFLDQYGLPNNYRRYVNLFVNGVKRGTIYDDVQQPGGDTVSEWFSSDSNGSLFKTDCWEEFTDAGAREPAGTGCILNSLEIFNTEGGVKKLARYRWNWRPRSINKTANDFSDLFNLVDAVNAPDSGYTSAVENVVDVENWMRTFAMNDLASFWDAFGNPNSKNTYLYKPENDGWKLMSWDFDVGLGVFNDPTDAPLFSVNDPTLVRMNQNPAWVRLYWGALDEAMNGFFQVGAGTAINALLDAKYAAFQSSGVVLEAPDSITAWINQRRAFLQTQLDTVAANFAVNGPTTFTTNRNLVTFSGTAPVRVRDILLNGVAYPIKWISPTVWQINGPLFAATNVFNIAGLDRFGAVVPGANATVTVNYTGLNPLASDNIVINEIMYNPLVPEASYVELHNRSTNYSFDLSGWEFNGLSFTFPSGTLLTNNGFFLLAKNPIAFANAYGYGIPVAAAFDGHLDTNGETLSLIIPGATSATDFVVDRVTYDDAPPWPAAANGFGPSLQLIDPAQDNNRVANWAAVSTNSVIAPQWIYFSTNGTASSSTLYIYLASAGDIYVDDFKFVAGSVPDAGANLLTNPGFESGLVGWNLTGNFAQSVLSTNIVHGGASSLRVVATSAGSGSGNAIFQTITPALTTGQPYALSFWYRQSTNGGPLLVRLSGAGVTTGSINPAPTASVAAAFTPGRANSGSALLPVFPQLWLNEIEPNNSLGLADNFNQRDPWIELYNSGTNALNLGGYFLADNYS